MHFQSKIFVFAVHYIIFQDCIWLVADTWRILKSSADRMVSLASSGYEIDSPYKVFRWSPSDLIDITFKNTGSLD